MNGGLSGPEAPRTFAVAPVLLALLVAAGCRTAQPERPVCLAPYYASSTMTYAPIESVGAYYPNRSVPSVVVVRVAEASLRPMAGAVVVLEPGRIGGITDSLGAVRIEGVRPGRYEVRAMQIGYRSIADSITHLPGGTDVAVVFAPGYRGLQACIITSAASSSEAEGESPIDNPDSH